MIFTSSSEIPRSSEVPRSSEIPRSSFSEVPQASASKFTSRSSFSEVPSRSSFSEVPSRSSASKLSEVPRVSFSPSLLSSISFSSTPVREVPNMQLRPDPVSKLSPEEATENSLAFRLKKVIDNHRSEQEKENLKHENLKKISNIESLKESLTTESFDENFKKRLDNCNSDIKEAPSNYESDRRRFFQEYQINSTIDSSIIPSACNQYGNYAACDSIGDSLLMNQQDLALEEHLQTTQETSKSLVHRLAQVDRFLVKRLLDNYTNSFTQSQVKSPTDKFKTMMDYRYHPDKVVEALIEAREKVESSYRKYGSIVLSMICSDNKVVAMIERAYYDRFPLNVTLYQVRFNNHIEPDKLLSVIDRLIGKYEALNQDREIVDRVTDLGDIINDVVEEYQSVEAKVNKYVKFRSTIQQICEDVIHLSELSQDLDLCEETITISEGVLDHLTKLEKSVVPERLEELTEEAEKAQNKFNYYQKISQAIRKRLTLPTEDNDESLPYYDWSSLISIKKEPLKEEPIITDTIPVEDSSSSDDEF